MAKKALPPPREPGTHTNLEVKEALHARAMRRSILITAVVFLLLASLAVVSSIAQEYEGEDDANYRPRMIVVVAPKLSPISVQRAMSGSKAPFMRLISSAGGAYATLTANAQSTPNAKIISILTGDASSSSSSANMLQGKTSFLRALKEAGYNPVVAAGRALWSGAEENIISGQCNVVGLLDSECSGTSCPAEDAPAYCNAYRKYVLSNNPQYYGEEVVDAFTRTLEVAGDAVYVQLNTFDAVEDPTNLERLLHIRSISNLLDNAIGTVALALAERTKTLKENWLMMVVGDGDDEHAHAPFLMAAYSNGDLVQLRPIADATYSTSSVFHTILRWFDVRGASESEVLGLCSTGIKVRNCKKEDA